MAVVAAIPVAHIPVEDVRQDFQAVALLTQEEDILQAVEEVTAEEDQEDVKSKNTKPQRNNSITNVKSDGKSPPDFFIS